LDKVGKKYRQDSSQYAPREIEFGYKAVYRPRNFGHSYSNQQVTLREAIVRSLNVVAVDAAMQVGLENVATW
jgi:membrane peptidoglycan carboxypeptidase